MLESLQLSLYLGIAASILAHKGCVYVTICMCVYIYIYGVVAHEGRTSFRCHEMSLANGSRSSPWRLGSQMSSTRFCLGREAGAKTQRAGSASAE